MGPAAVFTVATPNYFAQASTAIQSACTNDPKLEGFIFLLGQNLKKSRFKAKGIKVVFFDDLSEAHPELLQLAFRLPVFNLCCALKPFLAEHLFQENPKLKKVIYIDSDMMVFAPMTEVLSRLDHHPVVITPHLIDRTLTLNDGLNPSEGRILSSGVYNMGFFAVSREKEGLDFLNWWRERTFFKCIRSFSDGYFDDQKWIDLVPSLFPKTHILLHPGYNVAFWNLHERHFSRSGGQVKVNGEDLVVYHFSGWRMDRPGELSVHQNRHTLSTMPELRKIFHIYFQILLKNGSLEFASEEKPFTHFSNGIDIPDMAREIYNQCVARSPSAFQNPFEAAGAKSFFSWLVKPDFDGLSPILRAFYNSRSDLRDNFKDLNSLATRIGFVDWAIANGIREFQFTKPWGKVLKVSFAQARALLQSESSKLQLRKASLPVLGYGVNVIGFLGSEKGVGQSVRRSIDCLQSAAVPVKLFHFRDHRSQNVYRGDMSLPMDHSVNSTFSMNLVHLNAIDVGQLDRTFLGQMFTNRINIGYWVWELDQFPRQFADQFRFFEEIWTPSRFCQNSIGAHSPVPVVCMPHPVPDKYLDFKPAKRKNGPFTFFCSFDFDSGYERKNPEGVVQAFRSAFPKGTESVRLVIKCSRGEKFPELMERLKKKVGTEKRIQIVDSVLDSSQYLNLQAEADCCVSLHRAEGFGLNLLEAMALRKPVIGTNYSGSADFLSNQTGLPVQFKMTTMKDEFFPYPKGSRWADPDVEDAAEQMRFVFENPEKAEMLGKNAFNYVKENHSIEAISKQYFNRLRIVSLYRMRRVNA